jgi:putative copper export protein/mono/diheme cytochrome c family protein
VEHGLFDPLMVVRAVHLAATMMAAGAALFGCFVSEPAFRSVADAPSRLVQSVRARLSVVLVLSIAMALISGVGWLLLVAAGINDQPVSEVVTDGTAWLVLTQTRFGTVWQLRVLLALSLAACVALQPSRGRELFSASVGIVFAAALAWAGHGGATPGNAGYAHLIADVLHLAAAAAWVGALVPLALWLRAASHDLDAATLALAQNAVLRFSSIGVASVGTLLATGIVSGWFLAGTVPALVGTDYGRLLLVKVSLFAAMVSVAAFNRFRLTPRIWQGPSAAATNALRGLARNSAIEAVAGAMILLIVGVLGTMPPGLHQQATWPFSLRLNTAAVDDPNLQAAFFGTVGAIGFGAALVVVGILVRRLRWPAVAIGGAVVYFAGLSLPTTKAYPTTFYASPTGFSVQSIAAGEGLFAVHCAVCHGAEGRGDGSAGRLLKTKPADLTADHVYSHTDGDLFWRITHGIDPDMPGFGAVLDAEARWNLIDFIRADADATRLRAFGSGTDAAFPAPNFSAECHDGTSISIDQLRGEIVHVVIAGLHSDDWLRTVADRDVAEGLRTIVMAAGPEAASNTSLCVTHDPETIATFARYRGNSDLLEGTEFLIDAAGNLRSMWRSGDGPSGGGDEALQRRIESLRFAARVARSAGAHAHAH